MREVCSLLYLWLLKVEWSNMKISHKELYKLCEAKKYRS